MLGERDTEGGDIDGDTIGVTGEAVELGDIAGNGVIGVTTDGGVTLLEGTRTRSTSPLEEAIERLDGVPEALVTGRGDVDTEGVGVGDTSRGRDVLGVGEMDRGVADDEGDTTATGKDGVTADALGVDTDDDTGGGDTLTVGADVTDRRVVGIDEEGVDIDAEEGVTTRPGGNEDVVPDGTKLETLADGVLRLGILDEGSTLVEGVMMTTGGEEGVPEDTELEVLDVLGVATGREGELVDGVTVRIGGEELGLVLILDVLDTEEDEFEETETVGVKEGTLVLELGVIVGGDVIEVEPFDVIVIPQPSIEAMLVTQSMTGSGPPLAATVVKAVRKPPISAIALPSLAAGRAVVHVIVVFKQVLMLTETGILDVGVGVVKLEEFDVIVVPQPGIVTKDVAQSVSNCLFPITGKVVQATAVVMQEGRLIVGVVDELDVELTPQPGIEKNDVAQSVGATDCLFPMISGQETVLVMQEGKALDVVVLGAPEVVPHPGVVKNEVTQSVLNCLLPIMSGQETVLVMQGGRLLGVIVGKEVVLPQPNRIENEVAQSVCSCLLPMTGNVVQDTVLVKQVFTLLVGVGDDVIELLETTNIGTDDVGVTVGGLDVEIQLAAVE
ncbi:hypothetical protein BDZ45DRAFT_750540 [Acephala macrosclerotiorum]|nr:hypothetical protein BDZ45DRAFT_750540 [Acephala macrosclerotiorum]